MDSAGNEKEDTSVLEKILLRVKYFGHSPAVAEYLGRKKGIWWYFPKFLNSLFRGVSQVAFANNPFTGLIIVISLFIADPVVGLAALFACTVAITTAVLFEEESLITNGLTTYNALLVGTVTTSLLQPLYEITTGLEVWIYIFIGAVLSVIINNCVTNLMNGSTKILPPLTISFNLIQLIIFLFLWEKSGARDEPVQTSSLNVGDEGVYWPRLFEGAVLSVGQVYGVKNLHSSILIILAVGIYSPLHLALGFLGASVGTICGLLFSLTAGGMGDVYNGIWGYNGFLASVAISGTYFVPTPKSLVVALLNVFTAAVFQRGFQIAFNPINLPYLTVPYIFSTYLLLQMKMNGGEPFPVKHVTFAEMHLYEHLQQNTRRGKHDGSL